MLDAADRGVNYQATRKPGCVVHQIKQILHIPRVLPDEPQLEIFDYLHRSFIRTYGISFTDPVNTLVGQHLDIEPIPTTGADEKGFDVGYFHCGRVADLSSIQRLQPARRTVASTSSSASAESSLRALLRSGERRSGHQTAGPKKLSSLHAVLSKD